MATCDLNKPLIDDSYDSSQPSKTTKPAKAPNAPNANAPKKTKKRTYVKTTLQPVYVLPSSLPPTDEYEKIYGLEIKRAVESTLGIDEEYNSSRVECVQRHHGVYKIWLAENKDRYSVLIKGISLRGHHITTYGENPLSIDGQEAVRLKISNLDYRTSDEEVVITLRSIGFLLASNVMYESFRDEKGKLLKTKSGNRFVFIARPTFPFSGKIEIGEDLNVYISYKGMENDIEQLSKAHDAEKEPTISDSNISDTNSTSQNKSDQQTANLKADKTRHAQTFIEEFFGKQTSLKQSVNNQNNSAAENESTHQQPGSIPLGNSQLLNKNNSSETEPQSGQQHLAGKDGNGFEQQTTVVQEVDPQTNVQFESQNSAQSSSEAHNDGLFLEAGATSDAGLKLDEPSGPGHNSSESDPIDETAAASEVPHHHNTASDEEQSDSLLTPVPSNQHDTAEETSESATISSQSKNTAFSFMLSRGRQLQKSSSTPRVNPKTSRRITTHKKSILDKKRNLTERRRDSSLKRNNDNQTSYFDTDTGKRKKNKEAEKQMKENPVSFFSNSKKEVQRKLFAKGNNPSDEHFLIANDIINEVLSRIKY